MRGVNPSAGASSSLPRVTILCGFLGAGKTTLLRHLLQHSPQPEAERLRIAVVVNDVAALNIDATVVQTAGGQGDVVALENGCVCCSSRDDLAETVARLAAEGAYDHILVETTGVAEPRGVANLFVQRNPFGRSLADFARLAALVTVVDAAVLLQQAEGGLERGRQSPERGAPRPVGELLFEQVECADVVVINQIDRIDAAQREQARQVVAALNPRAETCETEMGQVALEFLLGRDRFDPAVTLNAARWIRDLNAVVPKPSGASTVHPLVQRPGPPRHEERFGIRSFVYQARRAFRREAFRDVVTSQLPGLLRAKGFYWLQEQPDEMGFLSIAGGVVRFDVLNPWWAALIESGRAKLEDRPPIIQALWQEPHGDRRQEIVFIGVGLDEAAVRRALDGCLVEAE